ncbi:MAG: hypothetical protein A2845_02655 [Candidatus Lloydbacteria bacterium RIFCSPHIGHO2_01_FULL_49_22]|uniref:Uncharacterized protein n=1 Tax=Candidatus Lloydbacteria bacterium RIFCSPHIGHO2_01_FULL_49_22 TaxID=1798658 RepID=A0A1G2CVB1_9BACT|nr:MAG: hypothetical protein A2845_02655 [Candidatus Lloydbacteria bacterium RIFCSPHIGHO2_01_FULL_49_22]OGZ10349.1 MAG: hypothetical protein A3C14_02355 [Candidatus Lloydbacteria bacterium RIFCSPHIGHO2_02_FULL_50_18]
MNNFEQINQNEHYEGGPSAYRAVWLQKKIKGTHLEFRDLPILAESAVARNIAHNFPEAMVIDSGTDAFRGFMYGEVAEQHPELSWVIIARNGGATPLVHIQNMQTGKLLPDSPAVYLESSWANGSNPYGA